VPERHTRLPSRQPLIVYSGGIHRSVTAAAEISIKKDRWAAQQGLARLPLGVGRSEAPRKYRGFVGWMPNLGLPFPAQPTANHDHRISPFLSRRRPHYA
jgi:hypothetical protein